MTRTPEYFSFFHLLSSFQFFKKTKNFVVAQKNKGKFCTSIPALPSILTHFETFLFQLIEVEQTRQHILKEGEKLLHYKILYPKYYR